MAGHQHAGLLSDEALLHNVAHGCEDCFDLLFLRFFRPTLRLAFRILRNRSEAEDIVQEVFPAMHQQRERFATGDSCGMVEAQSNLRFGGSDTRLLCLKPNLGQPEVIDGPDEPLELH
jgi:Sigma-70 region 2